MDVTRGRGVIDTPPRLGKSTYSRSMDEKSADLFLGSAEKSV